MFVIARMSKSVSIVITAITITACSSGGGNGAPPEPPIGDISGSWSFSQTFSSSNSECNDSFSATQEVTLSGNRLTTTGSSGTVFNGTMSGNSFTLSGSGAFGNFPGTLSQEISGTVDSTCHTMEATGTFSYIEDGFSCSGSSTLEGIRNSGPGCGSSTSETETEPNDTARTADVVTVGVPITGDITSSPENDDIFIFTTPSSGNYLISLDYNSPTIDIIVGIYDSNLNLLGQFGDKTIDANGLIAGETFYYQLDPDSTNGTLSYTLTVTEK